MKPIYKGERKGNEKKEVGAVKKAEWGSIKQKHKN